MSLGAPAEIKGKAQRFQRPISLITCGAGAGPCAGAGGRAGKEGQTGLAANFRQTAGECGCPATGVELRAGVDACYADSEQPLPLDPPLKLKHHDNRTMEREQVIATLRGHELELRAAGVIRLSLFGSTARGDRRPDSDIDLLAAFDDTRRISILDVAGIERQISQLLGRSVELVEEGTLKPRVRKNVEAEALRAF
jgi:uncharacterized protein